VVATIDKDLDQIPGEHYNYLRQVFYNQHPDAARQFFWEQCVSGDATDGIPGCYRAGSVKARRLLDRMVGSTEENIWEGIVREYAISQGIPGCPYLDRDPAAVALETARLVYIQQEEGELWNPPGEPMGILPEYLDDE
jgi:DNA polymerase-1